MYRKRELYSLIKKETERLSVEEVETMVFTMIEELKKHDENQKIIRNYRKEVSDEK